MLVSNNEEKVKKVRFWSTQSRDQARHYQHSELGFNYRMSNVVPASEEANWKCWINGSPRRNTSTNIIRENWDTLKESTSCLWTSDKPNYWLTSMTVTGKITPLEIMEKLEANNIESRPVWKPMHLRTRSFLSMTILVEMWVKNYLRMVYACRRILKMTDDDLQRVCKIIKGLWK